MSYILDALKKLEHEKSRKTRGGGIINISGALFENERSTPPGASGWKIGLAVIVAVLVTFTATWLFLQSGKGRADHSVRLAPPVSQAVPSPKIAVETAPQPTVVPQAVPMQQTPPATSPLPTQVTPVKPPVNSSRQKKADVQASTSTDDAAARLTMQELSKRQNERNKQELSADQAIVAPPDIKLSGIAWQEERHARRAVVNGFLMQEGGVVSGARITDIFQNRVRFTLSGKVFEIPLNSSGISAAGK